MVKIGRNEEVVDLDEGSFCAMACPETSLKGFIELMAGHVLMELGGNCSFQDFAQERMIGSCVSCLSPDLQARKTSPELLAWGPESRWKLWPGRPT